MVSGPKLKAEKCGFTRCQHTKPDQTGISWGKLSLIANRQPQGKTMPGLNPFFAMIKLPANAPGKHARVQTLNHADAGSGPIRRLA
jgi:hypothetical protein